MLYTSRPVDFDYDFDVVSLYLECEGEILLLHRQAHKSQGGKWGVPAGKVGASEDLKVALVREVFEETGLRVRADDIEHFKSVYVEHPEHRFVYHINHLAVSKKPAIRLSDGEHQDFRWVRPVDALSMNLVDDLDTCIEMFYLARNF